jgi:hypothetical protein
MEVVAKQNVKRISVATEHNFTHSVVFNSANRIFDIYTNALNPLNLLLDAGVVSYGVLYSDRSFVIHNWESVALDFTITTNLSRDDDSEVIFSLSRTGAKLFETVRVEADSQKQIYVQFIMEPIGDVQREHKRFEIHVNCRLVKDYQKVISFTAECRKANLKVSESEFYFNVSMKQTVDIFNSKNNNVFEICNLTDNTIQFQIMNESPHFFLESQLNTDNICGKHKSALVNRLISFFSRPEIESPNDGIWFPVKYFHSIELQPNETLQFRVLPCLDAIEKDIDQLRKQRYIIEHFSIYNTSNLQEKYRVSVKLNFGHLKDFHVTSS